MVITVKKEAVMGCKQRNFQGRSARCFLKKLFLFLLAPGL